MCTFHNRRDSVTFSRPVSGLAFDSVRRKGLTTIWCEWCSSFVFIRHDFWHFHIYWTSKQGCLLAFRAPTSLNKGFGGSLKSLRTHAGEEMSLPSHADQSWEDDDTWRHNNKDEIEWEERLHPIHAPRHPGLLSHNPSLCHRLGHPVQWQICLSGVQGLPWQAGILTTKINFETYQLFLQTTSLWLIQQEKAHDPIRVQRLDVVKHR